MLQRGLSIENTYLECEQQHPFPRNSMVEQREATRTSIFFFCHMASMRWTALLCHHGLKSLEPSANRNLPFIKLSPWVFITVKKKIWLWFGHHIEKWWVLKEVLETCGWSLSLKKCAGLWSLVLWLPGVRWESFISNTFLPLACITRYHGEGSHCNWADEESSSTLEPSVFWSK